MANKHMKRCSILLAIREMQIKTTVRHHFTPTNMTIIKKKRQITTRVGENMEKSEPSYTAGGGTGGRGTGQVVSYSL